ncbi:MAG: PH domain-containing protein [Muribaculaceae bacterium]|nr:PH domain-containing protein [Muribaculaceae bacterium]
MGFLLCLGLGILLMVGMEWYIVLIIGVIFVGYVGVSCFQISYVIKDDELGVHTQTKWIWYPIENIKEVKKVKSILAAPAMSFTRIAIKFNRGTTIIELSNHYK